MWLELSPRKADPCVAVGQAFQADDTKNEP